ncbi:hypothetical protein GGQ87_000109 [Brevundimonas alba]|uniref:Uncharacterized protein n=1 Tax=Brevundimonas alba TaxID=74314 RepID=A0A7X5YH16_9CAUL|nr:hypothetical protein [Brevundimonas alba]NJC39851.1 hypothetical protein [Brevundimonas alba]
MLKTAAYLFSILGLSLLAAASWMQADADPAVRAALGGGALLSLAGLLLRLMWHCREQRCDVPQLRPVERPDSSRLAR